MATITSGLVNIVEFTKLEYATVDPTSATLPTVLSSISAAELLDGTFNLDIPAESLSADYTEDGDTFNMRTSPSMKKASIGLVTATGATIKDFVSSTFTAGAIGVTADKLKVGASTDAVITNKYVKISGKNSDGKLIVVELFNAKVTHSWSGNNGRSQAPAPFMVTFAVLKNRGYGASYQISPIF